MYQKLESPQDLIGDRLQRIARRHRVLRRGVLIRQPVDRIVGLIEIGIRRRHVDVRFQDVADGAVIEGAGVRAGGDGRAVLGDGCGIVDVRGAVVADVADGDAVEVIVQLARIAARLVVVGLVALHHLAVHVVDQADRARPPVGDGHRGQVIAVEVVIVDGVPLIRAAVLVDLVVVIGLRDLRRIPPGIGVLHVGVGVIAAGLERVGRLVGEDATRRR